MSCLKIDQHKLMGPPKSSNHATHVSGTMIGSGSPQNGNAKGDGT